MSHDEHIYYHRERERHCRSMAELAADPEIRRRHRELAELHAARAARFTNCTESGSGLGVA